MKMHTLVLTAIAAISATAAAAETTPRPEPFRLAEMVTYMESTYGGRVTAIELDASGDKRPHYHVDLWYPEAGSAQVDVDAVSRKIVARDAGQLPAGSATLAEVAMLVSTQLPGRLTIAQLDTDDGARPHYDVDVRVDERRIARLKIDAATRAIAWRQPPVVVE